MYVIDTRTSWFYKFHSNSVQVQVQEHAQLQSEREFRVTNDMVSECSRLPYSCTTST